MPDGILPRHTRSPVADQRASLFSLTSSQPPHWRCSVQLTRLRCCSPLLSAVVIAIASGTCCTPQLQCEYVIRAVSQTTSFPILDRKPSTRWPFLARRVAVAMANDHHHVTAAPPASTYDLAPRSLDPPSLVVPAAPRPTTSADQEMATSHI